MFCGISFWVTWSAAITLWIRRIEGERRALTYASLIFNGAGTAIYLLSSFIWLVAAFRTDVSPEIVRMLNDAGWLMFVWTAPPFSLWFMLIGVAILIDRNNPSLFPRWVGYLNFVFAGDCMFVLTTAFFKTGPLSWAGVISFWNIAVTYLIWTIVMLVVMLKGLKSEENPRLVSEEAEVAVLASV